MATLRKNWIESDILAFFKKVNFVARLSGILTEGKPSPHSANVTLWVVELFIAIRHK